MGGKQYRSSAFTPQWNSVAKRTNRILLEKVKVILSIAGMNQAFCIVSAQSPWALCRSDAKCSVCAQQEKKASTEREDLHGYTTEREA